MIFRTITDDITGANKSIGLFGKSLNDFKGIINSFKQNGFVNTLLNTPLINIDTDAIDSYNDAIKSGMPYEQALAEARETTNASTLALIESSHGAEVQIERVTAAQKASTIAAKAHSAALKAVSIAGNMIAMWGISVVISKVAETIDELVHSEENLRQSASDLGSELSNNSSDIKGYKQKIEELKSVINDSSSSFDEVSQARVDLMEIQDELIKKFGTEKGVIENITAAINDQTDALDGLSKKSYFKAKNEFNKKTGGEKFADWLSFGNTDDDRAQTNMDKMVSAMRYSFFELETTGNEVLDNLIAKSYGLNIVDNMYGNGKHFQVYGTLDEIQNKLYGIQELLQDFDLSTGFENSFTQISNDVGDALEKYKNLYDQYVLYEKILTDNQNNQYDEQFDLINKAKEAYNEAVKSGNEEELKTSADEYAKTLQSAIDLAIGNYDYDVADYFKSMYPELQQMFGEWQFNLNFEPNTDGLQDKVVSALDSIDGVSDGVTSFSMEDIENFNPNIATQEQIEAYGELTNVAESYGLTVKQLITLLQTMGLIQSESYQQLADTFGQENVDKLSPEDLEIAYTIENAGNMTFEQLKAEIQKIKEAVTEQPITLSISQTIDQLNTQLKPAFDSLQSAYKDIFDDDGKFQLNTIDILSTCDSIKSKLDELNKIEGITVDYTAFEDFVRVLNNTESTEQDVETAFDSLATSITQAALSGAEDFETMKSALEDLGVVNSEMVAFDALIKNTEALKEAGLDLADATYDDIEAFVRGIGITENYSQAVNLLKIQKILCAENPLSTTADIQNLYNLAQAAGIATDAIRALMTLNTAYTEASAEGNTLAATAVKGQMELVKKQVMDQFANIGSEVDFSNIGGGTKSAGKAGSSAGDAYVDAFEKELKALEDLRNNGLISEKEYLDRLRVDINALSYSNVG